MLQKFADAEDVIGVADRDATVQAVGAHDHADAYADSAVSRPWVSAIRLRSGTRGASDGPRPTPPSLKVGSAAAPPVVMTTGATPR